MLAGSQISGLLGYCVFFSCEREFCFLYILRKFNILIHNFPVKWLLLLMAVSIFNVSFTTTYSMWGVGPTLDISPTLFFPVLLWNELLTSHVGSGQGGLGAAWFLLCYGSICLPAVPHWNHIVLISFNIWRTGLSSFLILSKKSPWF